MPLSLFGDQGVAATEAPGLEGVGFWRRALAQGIDLLVHLLVGLVTGLTTGILVAIGAVLQEISAEPAMERLMANGALGIAAALIGSTAMHTLSEGLHGSTLGKRLCGIIVISEDGGPSTLVGALKRSIAYFVDSLFFGLVAAQKMKESPKRQRIGDVWGHTMVVRIATLDVSARRSWLRFAAGLLLGLAADGLIIFLELASRLIA
jgi:uncharacterized RDD family membrane protein YckC